MLILHLVSAIIFLFTAFSLFFRADCSMGIKVCGSALILLASMKYVIYQLIGGAFFAPQLPRAMLLALEAMYGALILLFFLLLIWDIYLLGNWLLAKTGMPTPAKLPSGAIKSCMVILSLGLGIWGVWQSIKTPETHTIEMRLDNLPAEFDGFSIVQLSDLHIGPILKKDWLEEVVAKTNSLRPDLIALTGDYVDGLVSQLETELQPLGDLRAKYGIFGVTGNHEYYWNAAEWTEVLQRLGVTMLNNEHDIISINGETLVIAGLPDLVAARFGFAGPDIHAALDNAPEAVRILLAHQPKPAREYARLADLHLAGHTHGGQIFFLQQLIARFNNGFIKGAYPVDNKKLYVSPGTGLWGGFSCRIGVPSEITRIILRSAS